MIRTTLRSLLCMLPLLFLSGCPYPGAPLVGLPSGDRIARETVLYDSMENADDEPRLRIVEQQIDHNYYVFFSPDGSRPDQTLHQSVKHLVRHADGSSKELPFLKHSYLNNGRAQAAPLYKVQGAENWLGFTEFSNAKTPRSEPPLRFYIVTVFSENGVVSRNEIFSTTRPVYEVERKALRFTAADGPRLLLAMENRIVAEEAR